MEAFAILGFIFGLVAFVRIEKNILQEDYKEE